MEIVIAIVSAVVALGAGFFFGKSSVKSTLGKQEEELKAAAEQQLADAKRKSEQIISDANRSAENTKKDKMLEAKEHFLQYVFEQ